ncbi:MAG: hypothetical protein QNJ97_07070 [Myxococcota bacterium]|nr:hypothetical protein [Myxococcota bacterium]
MLGRFSKCFVAIVLVVVTGCAFGGAKSKSTKSINSDKRGKKGLDYRVYAPLNTVHLKKLQLPALVGPDGVDPTPCLEPVKKLSQREADENTRGIVNEHWKKISKTIQHWFLRDLEIPGLTEELTRAWQVKADGLVLATVPNEALRFVEEQQCFNENGKLPKGVHLATTLIGAHTLEFQTDRPINPEIQEEMLSAVGAENMTIESDAFFSYKKVLDKRGNPVKNAAGEVLFESPDGQPITEKEVPPPENRYMKKWVLKSERPIYFAYQVPPKKTIRHERKTDLCDVYLVWNDAAPQTPDCPEFQEAVFWIRKEDDGNAILTLKTSDKTVTQEFYLGASGMVQVDSRILLWLKVKEIEEGARVLINSLVLNPKPIAGKAESTADAKESYSQDQQQPHSKKKIRSNNSALDNYLSE